MAGTGLKWIFTQVENRKILNLLRYSIKCLVHSHTFFIVVVAETDTDDTIFFNEDGLVDVPAGVKAYAR